MLLFILLTFMAVVSAAEVQERPATIEYERKLMDAIEDDKIWEGLSTELSPRADAVHLITGEFFDTHLVSRLTSQWIGGNTTWIIGITKPGSWDKNYNHPLVGKTIRILSDIYAGNETIRFGLIDFTKNEELKEGLVGKQEPRLIMIHNGQVYA